LIRNQPRLAIITPCCALPVGRQTLPQELIDRNQYKINASITGHVFHLSKSVLASPSLHEAHCI